MELSRVPVKGAALVTLNEIKDSMGFSSLSDTLVHVIHCYQGATPSPPAAPQQATTKATEPPPRPPFSL